MARKKTTIYLPDDLKTQIENTASSEGCSEADVIREALHKHVGEMELASPKIPLVPYGLGAPDIAERVDELLEGFGRCS